MSELNYKKERIVWNKGKTNIYSAVTLEKMRNARLGKPAWNSGKGEYLSKEVRERINVAKRGKPTWNKGKLDWLSSEQKENIRIANFKRSGNTTGLRIHTNWYTKEFNKKLKTEIMERDGYQCCNPGCFGLTKRLTVHHIDYNKQNCRPLNLITLCSSCNARANTYRNSLFNFYKILVEEKCQIQNWIMNEMSELMLIPLM